MVHSPTFSYELSALEKLIAYSFLTFKANSIFVFGYGVSTGD